VKNTLKVASNPRIKRNFLNSNLAHNAPMNSACTWVKKTLFYIL